MLYKNGHPLFVHITKGFIYKDFPPQQSAAGSKKSKKWEKRKMGKLKNGKNEKWEKRIWGYNHMGV